jgi:hypothetical protein
MNVVTALRNRKAQLESEVAELTAQAGQLWEAIPNGVGFEYDENEDNKAVPPCSFWPTSEENWTAGSWTPAPEGHSKLGVAVVDSRCAYCGSCDGFVQREMPAGSTVYVSAWCAVCGWPASSDASYLFFVLPAKPFVALAQILKVLSHYAGLLRLVIAAVTVLLARLRSAARRRATCQRKFFTHHGAHPPRAQPRRAPGLLLGRVFQFPIAS